MNYILLALTITLVKAFSSTSAPENIDGLDVLYKKNKLNEFIEDLVDVSDRTKATLSLAANFRKRVGQDEVDSFNQFFRFIIKYQKEYKSDREISQIFQKFKTSQKNILSAKKRNPHANFGITKFSDLTPEEFIGQYTGVSQKAVELLRAKFNSSDDSGEEGAFTQAYNTQDGWTRSRPGSTPPSSSDPSSAFDWRLLGGVTPVKDQGKCGASYAFAALAAVESVFTIKTQKEVSLSEQHAIACTYNNTDYDNDGCQGGDPDEILHFSVEQGLVTENSWPYKLQYYREGSRIARCKKFRSQQRYFNYHEHLPQYDDKVMMERLISTGPLVSYIDASDLQFYLNGIITAKSKDINHAVLTVGYGTTLRGGGAYWIAKNSWGEDFGEQGYVRVGRGKNSANIEAFNIAIVP